MDEELLKQAELDELSLLGQRVGFCDPSRRNLLLSGIPTAIVLSLPVMERPLDQLLSDLTQLNKVELNASASIEPPIMQWLKNALKLAADRHEQGRLGELSHHAQRRYLIRRRRRAVDGRAVKAPSENTDKRLLVGIAVDLSGSMQMSIRNDTGGATTRLESFRQSLDRLVSDARRNLREERGGANKDRVELFVYGFGMRHRSLEHCDLLALVRAAESLLSREEIERLKVLHERRIRARYESQSARYSGLGALAASLGLGGLVSQAEATIRQQAEGEVRAAVLDDIALQLISHLQTADDCTLTLEQLGDLWGSKSKESLASAQEFIFGSTPMRSALEAVNDRFERELSQRTSDTLATLFVLSDGGSTDGDPSEALQRIRELGVTVVSCFVTSEDVADPRRLYPYQLSAWSSAAQLMFRNSSLLDPQSEVAAFLAQKGWVIPQDAHLFLQLNHSDMLNEFMDVLLVPMSRDTANWQLPEGE